MKKVFTDSDLAALDSKSDVELIEEMNTTTNIVTRQLIEALLDRRLKRVLQDLTDSVKAGNKTTTSYNMTLIWLTAIIAFLTVVMAIATVVVVFK